MLDSGMTNRSVGVSAELRVAAKQVPHRLACPSCFSPKLRIRCLLVHASVVLGPRSIKRWRLVLILFLGGTPPSGTA